MPELPEVEAFKLHFDETSLNKEITGTTIHDDYVLKMDPEAFKQEMKGNTFHDSVRHGKNLFAQLDSEALLFHFGMSGTLEYFKESEKEPEYSKIIFDFQDRGFLSYISVRKLGKVKIIGEVSNYLEEKGLGPDALTVTSEKFLEVMSTKRSFAKTALMDQETIAGIGNIYSDEILFQAGIHPKLKIGHLDTEQLKQLHRETKSVLQQAMDSLTSGKDLPENFIIPHRDEDDHCPRCGAGIQRVKISSRHGYFCPNCQSK